MVTVADDRRAIETHTMNRRRFVAAALIASAIGLIDAVPLNAKEIGQSRAMSPNDPDAVRPFRIQIPEVALTDMKRRILATRWPDRETVGDTSQGLKLATMKAVTDYWVNDYDWRKAETSS